VRVSRAADNLFPLFIQAEQPPHITIPNNSKYVTPLRLAEM
jgi:hypothetical protein